MTSPALQRLQTSYQGASATLSSVASQSNLARAVYCVLGIPIDAVNLSTVVSRIKSAAAAREIFLISTPNLNFLVNSLSDPEFRESLLDSDLCPPDGAPLVFIARLLGLPIKERATGADLLERLQVGDTGVHSLTTFLFGGAKGVAAAAASKLNARPGGLTCVGTMDPGFGEISEMSTDHIIDEVNASGADFLVLALGAKKGQSWLRRNHDRLTIPIRSHLGAAINFQAGIVKRAPPMVRAWGAEWLWRIKEERYLWRRYRDDGFVLLRLLFTRILPLAFLTRWHRLKAKHQSLELSIEQMHHDRYIVMSLHGAASESQILSTISCFQEALTGNATKKDFVIDLSDVQMIDARFLGLLLMLRKELGRQGARLKFTAVPPAIKRLFRLNEVGFLLSYDT